MDQKEIAPTMFRKLFVTVTNTMFTAFLNKARADGWNNVEKKVDIEGIMRLLVGAYSEGRVVILNAHDVHESKKKLAAELVAASRTYGTEAKHE